MIFYEIYVVQQYVESSIIRTKRLSVYSFRQMVSEQLTSDLLTHKVIQFMAHIACYVRQLFA